MYPGKQLSWAQGATGFAANADWDWDFFSPAGPANSSGAHACYSRSRISSIATLPPFSTLMTLWIGLNPVRVTSTT